MIRHNIRGSALPTNNPVAYLAKNSMESMILGKIPDNKKRR